MKKQATTRKISVKNSRFIAAMRASVATRTDRHAQIVEHAQRSGVVETLVKVNRKKATND